MINHSFSDVVSAVSSIDVRNLGLRRNEQSYSDDAVVIKASPYFIPTQARLKIPGVEFGTNDGTRIARAVKLAIYSDIPVEEIVTQRIPAEEMLLWYDAAKRAAVEAKANGYSGLYWSAEEIAARAAAGYTHLPSAEGVIADWRRFGFSPDAFHLWILVGHLDPYTAYVTTNISQSAPGWEFAIEHALYEVNEKHSSILTNEALRRGSAIVTAVTGGVGDISDTVLAEKVHATIIECGPWGKWDKWKPDSVIRLIEAGVPISYADEAYSDIRENNVAFVIEAYNRGIPAEWARVVPKWR